MRSTLSRSARWYGKSCVPCLVCSETGRVVVDSSSTGEVWD